MLFEESVIDVDRWFEQLDRARSAPEMERRGVLLKIGLSGKPTGIKEIINTFMKLMLAPRVSDSIGDRTIGTSSRTPYSTLGNSN